MGRGRDIRQNEAVSLGGPIHVARIEFLEWTPDDRLRHPGFAGIRSEKDANEVVLEEIGRLVPSRQLER